MHRALILKKINQAMIFACEQSEVFTDAKQEPITAEYLFTVAVASAIAELNGPPGEPYVIRVERAATTFATDCLKPIKFAPSGPQGRGDMIRRGRPDVDRKGRIDVSVYTEVPSSGYWGKQPLCAIEVKGFNPNVAVVIPDLKRNLEFLRLKGDTGPSVLNFTVFAAFHSFTRLGDQDIAKNEQRVQKKYMGYLKKLGDLSDVEVVVNVSTVSVEQIGTVVQGVDYDELDTRSRHHFVGAMVIMSHAARV